MDSKNLTNLTTSMYVFIPINYNIKASIAAANVIAGIYGLVANALILYFIKKRPTFNQVLLADRFIQSLALSDVLSSLISLPIFTSEMFVDFITSDMTCKFVRYNNIYFIIVTVMSYLVIGIERYLGVFYPLLIPRRKLWNGLVCASWFLGAVVMMIPMPSYNLVQFDLGNGFHTHTCKYDKSTRRKRAYFLAFTAIGYLIPCAILLVTSIRMIRFIRSQRRVAPNINIQLQGLNIIRNKITKMFVFLIIAFIIPYIAYTLYSCVAVVFKLELSFTVDYIIRYVVTFFAFSNGAVGSSVMFYNSSYLRKKILKMFRRY